MYYSILLSEPVDFGKWCLKTGTYKHKLNDDLVVPEVPSSPLRKMARRFTLMSTFLALYIFMFGSSLK